MSTPQRTAILNVVGLTPRVLGPDTPRLLAAAQAGGLLRVKPVLPAVTCTAQSTYLTGRTPAGHGCVANGWYDRTLAEHQFWKQSNHVVQGPKLWETLRERRPGFTCAKLFWWYNMYSTADWSITPRPMYPADGRKVFDVYTHPMGLREQIKADLGPFPFPAFWGPLAGIASSEWIARSAEWVEERHRPDLSLVYLPHLDYNLQRLGPDDPRLADDAGVTGVDLAAGDTDIRDAYRLTGQAANSRLSASMLLGDFNGDGYDDVVVSGRDFATILLGPVDLDGVEPAGQRGGVVIDLAGGWYLAESGGDINADGLADLVLARLNVEGGNAQVAVLLGRHEPLRSYAASDLPVVVTMDGASYARLAPTVRLLNWETTAGDDMAVLFSQPGPTASKYIGAMFRGTTMTTALGNGTTAA
ncbi:MAG: alkaline phosphatase family protein, partial [Verrucomicrobia bacterium]|nr:alkaline phosphatase family protein [Verrucomicrobiota bacterium]